MPQRGKSTPSAKRRSPYHHGSLRVALIQASLQLIAREGIAALTLRKVAKMAGVTHAAPYAHFTDKEDLIAALKEEGFTELRKRIQQVMESGEANEREVLAKSAAAYVQFALAHPAMFQVMFRNPLESGRPETSSRFVQPGQDVFAMLESAFQRTLVKKNESKLTSLMGWAMIHGLVSLRIDGPLSHIVPESEPEKAFQNLAAQLVSRLLVLLGV
jgi:AcrR family transcriptional regulator